MFKKTNADFGVGTLWDACIVGCVYCGFYTTLKYFTKTKFASIFFFSETTLCKSLKKFYFVKNQSSDIKSWKKGSVMVAIHGICKKNKRIHFIVGFAEKPHV